VVTKSPSSSATAGLTFIKIPPATPAPVDRTKDRRSTLAALDEDTAEREVDLTMTSDVGVSADNDKENAAAVPKMARIKKMLISFMVG
jgi:hypothetical protein